MAEKSVSTESFATEKTEAFTGKKFRVAFIGCGGISHTHMGALTTFPDVEVVAGVDTDAERLAAWGEKYGVTQLYADWADHVGRGQARRRERVYAQRRPRPAEH